MFYCFPNVIETKKTQNIFHLTRVAVGGGKGQDGKWSHFPPFFVVESFPEGKWPKSSKTHGEWGGGGGGGGLPGSKSVEALFA